MHPCGDGHTHKPCSLTAVVNVQTNKPSSADRPCSSPDRGSGNAQQRDLKPAALSLLRLLLANKQIQMGRRLGANACFNNDVALLANHTEGLALVLHLRDPRARQVRQQRMAAVGPRTYICFITARNSARSLLNSKSTTPESTTSVFRRLLAALESVMKQAYVG